MSQSLDDKFMTLLLGYNQLENVLEEPMINVAVKSHSVSHSLLLSSTSPRVKYFRTLCDGGTKSIPLLCCC